MVDFLKELEAREYRLNVALIVYLLKVDELWDEYKQKNEINNLLSEENSSLRLLIKKLNKIIQSDFSWKRKQESNVECEGYSQNLSILDIYFEGDYFLEEFHQQYTICDLSVVMNLEKNSDWNLLEKMIQKKERTENLSIFLKSILCKKREYHDFFTDQQKSWLAKLLKERQNYLRELRKREETTPSLTNISGFFEDRRDYFQLEVTPKPSQSILTDTKPRVQLTSVPEGYVLPKQINENIKDVFEKNGMSSQVEKTILIDPPKKELEAFYTIHLEMDTPTEEQVIDIEDELMREYNNFSPLISSANGSFVIGIAFEKLKQSGKESLPSKEQIVEKVKNLVKKYIPNTPSSQIEVIDEFESLSEEEKQKSSDQIFQIKMTEKQVKWYTEILEKVKTSNNPISDIKECFVSAFSTFQYLDPKQEKKKAEVDQKNPTSLTEIVKQLGPTHLKMNDDEFLKSLGFNFDQINSKNQNESISEKSLIKQNITEEQYQTIREQDKNIDDIYRVIKYKDGMRIELMEGGYCKIYQKNLNNIDFPFVPATIYQDNQLVNRCVNLGDLIAAQKNERENEIDPQTKQKTQFESVWGGQLGIQSDNMLQYQKEYIEKYDKLRQNAFLILRRRFLNTQEWNQNFLLNLEAIMKQEKVNQEQFEQFQKIFDQYISLLNSVFQSDYQCLIQKPKDRTEAHDLCMNLFDYVKLTDVIYKKLICVQRQLSILYKTLIKSYKFILPNCDYDLNKPTEAIRSKILGAINSLYVTAFNTFKTFASYTARFVKKHKWICLTLGVGAVYIIPTLAAALTTGSSIGILGAAIVPWYVQVSWIGLEVFRVFGCSLLKKGSSLFIQVIIFPVLIRLATLFIHVFCSTTSFLISTSMIGPLASIGIIPKISEIISLAIGTVYSFKKMGDVIAFFTKFAAEGTKTLVQFLNDLTQTKEKNVSTVWKITNLITWIPYYLYKNLNLTTGAQIVEGIIWIFLYFFFTSSTLEKSILYYFGCTSEKPIEEELKKNLDKNGKEIEESNFWKYFNLETYTSIFQSDPNEEKIFGAQSLFQQVLIKRNLVNPVNNAKIGLELIGKKGYTFTETTKDIFKIDEATKIKLNDLGNFFSWKNLLTFGFFGKGSDVSQNQRKYLNIGYGLYNFRRGLITKEQLFNLFRSKLPEMESKDPSIRQTENLPILNTDEYTQYLKQINYEGAFKDTLKIPSEDIFKSIENEVFSDIAEEQGANASGTQYWNKGIKKILNFQKHPYNPFRMVSIDTLFYPVLITIFAANLDSFFSDIQNEEKITITEKVQQQINLLKSDSLFTTIFKNCDNPFSDQCLPTFVSPTFPLPS